MTEEPSPEELELARLLLAERAPEQLAAALVKLYRSRLPALEEVEDPGTGPSPREKPGRGAREPREKSGRGAPARIPKTAAARFPEGAAWFRLDIGRAKNADPKWLLPMLCRKGDITKQDIGVIRIFDKETQFEVVGGGRGALRRQYAPSWRRAGAGRADERGAGGPSHGARRRPEAETPPEDR